MTPQRFVHRLNYWRTCAGAEVKNWRAYSVRSPAALFYETLTPGFDPEAHIDVLPAYNLIYVSIPKNASTTIKAFLASLNGRRAPAPEIVHTRRQSGILSPSRASLSTFHKIAKSPTSLRFSFVRNPYTRLLSAWADKFENKRLDQGDPFVGVYLKYKSDAGARRAADTAESVSFGEFADFACATAQHRLNAHWNLQHELLDFPGLDLNFVGHVETFAEDFARLIDRLGPLADQPKRPVAIHHNSSRRHRSWQDYYTPELAKTVFPAYERDFDRFGYPASIRNTA